MPPQALICSSQGPLCADKQWVLLHADPHPVSQHWGGWGEVKLSSGAVGPKNNSHPMIKKKEFIQFQTRSAMKSPWRFGAHIGAQTLNNQK